MEVALKLRPGVNVEFTPTLNESGVSSCNLLRYKAGLPEKLGGWTRYYPFALSGVPRDLHAWQDTNAVGRLAIGTTQQLAVITNGTLSDITPQTLVSDFTPDFSTVNGTTTVTIVDPNITNVTTLDSIYFNTPISVGGIVLAGLYPIASVGGASTYTIEAATAATSTVNNGGAVPVFDTTSGTSEVHVTLNNHELALGGNADFPLSTTVGGTTIAAGGYRVIQVISANIFAISAPSQASSTATESMNGGDAELVYYINLGPPATGVGYGVGGYGLGGYGTGVVPSSQTGTPITATNWTSDNWGSILLECPQGGGIYYWDPTGGFLNAALVSQGPPFNGGIFVAMPQQILVAWGSTSTLDLGVLQDPLLVRWSDAEDFLEWTVTSTTQAGSFHIPTGSRIVGGVQGPQQALIWTDIDLWAMRYLGPPLVFGFNKLSSGCGLVGPHAATTMRGNVYWMSPGNFFILSGGGVEEIPCPVWDVIFQNIDTDNQQKCVAAPNSSFDEIAFYYPSLSGGTGEIDSYVKYNTEEKTWDYGSLARTAWVDQSVIGQPTGTTPNGLIFQHETSYDADGQAMNPFFQTGWFVISEGQNFAFVDWFFPDMKWTTYGSATSASVQVTIYAADYPNGTVRTYGPFSMSSAQAYINCRLRGRQIMMRFESSDLGSFWRLGNMRYRVAQDGRR